MTMNDHGEKSILDRIVAAKRKRITADKSVVSPRTMLGAAEKANRDVAPLDFCRAIGSPTSISVIAEMKRSSPSAGVMDPSLDPAQRARDLLPSGRGCDFGAD